METSSKTPGHETTPLRGKGDTEDVFSELDNGGYLLHFLVEKPRILLLSRILFSDEAHFWLNGYVNQQNCRIWREANPQVYVGTPLHPEKLTVWCALWAGGILLQKR
ncbi:uncharacterized protein TNCV_1261731 [Trichonephila clavipes]|nr:uncharacterized protein TNCV_1261731 [Trichonephila clavipes]